MSKRKALLSFAKWRSYQCKGIRRSDTKTAKAREQEAGRVLRQTAGPFLFSLRVRACPPEERFHARQLSLARLRHVFYAISRSLMKSLTERNARIRSRTLHRRGVQITTGACGRRYDHKGPADSSIGKIKRRGNGEGGEGGMREKGRKPRRRGASVRWMDANRGFGIFSVDRFFERISADGPNGGSNRPGTRTQWISWMMQRCGSLPPIGAIVLMHNRDLKRRMVTTTNHRMCFITSQFAYRFFEYSLRAFCDRFNFNKFYF